MTTKSELLAKFDELKQAVHDFAHHRRQELHGRLLSVVRGRDWRACPGRRLVRRNVQSTVPALNEPLSKVQFALAMTPVLGCEVNETMPPMTLLAA